MTNSAEVKALLIRNFPSLPEEIAQYLTDILSGNLEDFRCLNDITEAVTDHILSSCDDVDEKQVDVVCKSLAEILISADNNKSLETHGKRVLDGPMHLGTDETTENGQDAVGSIWMVKRDQSSTVDQKKLEKAEAKIQEKKDKRSNKDPAPIIKFQDVGATASQAANRRDATKDAQGGTAVGMDVRIENIDLAFGDKQLLKGANLILAYGRRHGLVGRNGIGKTTLFKMIASGQLSIPSCIRMLHVAQEVVGDNTPILTCVLSSDTKREELLAEEKRLQEVIASSSSKGTEDYSGRLNQVYRELENCEADKAPALAAGILSGLGFKHEDHQRPTKEFSGGWRMRLALAQGLFMKPDLLLLDEPTNMLDMKAIFWLENYLQSWPSTLFVVSHDRNFLNSVCTDMHHMHSQRIDSYKGNYDNFEKTKDEKLKQQQKEYEAQMQLRAHAQAFIDKFRYNAKRASLAQSKIKMLERLPVLTPVDSIHQVVLKFADTEPLNPPVFQMDEVTFRYSPDQPTIFENLCVGADTDSRICIVGENGVGKTTLLKLLMGDLEPSGGQRNAHRHLKIGYFAQHHVDQLQMDQSSLEAAAQRFPGLNVEVYRSALGKFGLSGDLALQSVNTLSGGQKSRLAFALLTMAAPNFLIMDEPTNHLDVETVEALGRALCKYKGGVVLVSHDERLIEIVCTELWVVRNKKVDKLEGLEEYKKLVCKEMGLLV